MSTTTETVWAFRTDLPIEQVEVHAAQLDELGLLGLTEEAGRTTGWFPARTDGIGLPGVWEAVPATGWDTAWRAQLEPVTAGPFVITPPWKATGGAEEIIIEPAQAFGTGHHETTIGCVTALASLRMTGATVLDVGTGTGVLGIAAAKLGAAQIVACDTDDLAVTAARDNAQRNGVTGTSMRVLAGSLDAVPPGQFDVVVANLSTQVVCSLASALVERCAGTLVVSGVGLERVDEAVTALRAAGVEPRITQGREWTVLTGQTHES